MTIKSAIVQRLQEICEAKAIKPNDLAVRSGITPSTVYSLLDPKRKDLSVITLKKLCDGLNIPLVEFFDTDVFRNLEQEIK
ncbi:MAG: helix-turn-helix transcriptional regulator [Oscillospiraceae bacterium]|nr:helix-turn-helix transcriptional regulator [Oscillospiraceae bacterium]